AAPADAAQDAANRVRRSRSLRKTRRPLLFRLSRDTLIAERLPLRTVRAGFPQAAPTSVEDFYLILLAGLPAHPSIPFQKLQFMRRKAFKKFPIISKNFHFFPRIETCQGFTRRVKRKKSLAPGSPSAPPQGPRPARLVHLALARRALRPSPLMKQMDYIILNPQSFCRGWFE